MSELQDARARIEAFSDGMQARGEVMPSQASARWLDTLLSDLESAIRRLDKPADVRLADAQAERDMLGRQLQSVVDLCAQAERAKRWLLPVGAVHDLVIRDPGDGHPHPEDRCGRCGGVNRPWSAPSPLWNQVMRDGSINGDEPYRGIVCPTCFMVLAEDAGVAQLWRLSAERVHVELQTVAPSGRVWDDEWWQWVDADSLRLPHASCSRHDLHEAHRHGDPQHWCEGSGDVSDSGISGSDTGVDVSSC